jgi:hypothetical protein
VDRETGEKLINEEQRALQSKPYKRMLAYITGSVSEDLLRRIEYLLGKSGFAKKESAIFLKKLVRPLGLEPRTR